MRRRARWRWGCVAGSVLSLLSANMEGLAQSASGMEQQQAKALFDEGKALSANGDCEAAIQKFKESIATDPGDPQVEISNRFLIAECQITLGRLLSAHSTFLEAKTTAIKHNRTADAQEAEQKAVELEPRIPRLKIVVEQDELKAGMKVWVNGKAWVPGNWNRGELVDGGEYLVEAQASGSDKWSSRVRVEGEGKTREVVVPKLVAKAGEEGADAMGKPLDYRFWLGLGGVAVGTAGLITGGVYGSRYSDSKLMEEQYWNRVDDPANNRNDACVQPMLTEQVEADCDKLQAQVDESKALSQKTVGFLVAGGIVTAAGLGTLIWYYLDKPEAKKDDKSLRILPGAPGTWAGIGIGGTF